MNSKYKGLVEVTYHVIEENSFMTFNDGIYTINDLGVIYKNFSSYVHNFINHNLAQIIIIILQSYQVFKSRCTFHGLLISISSNFDYLLCFK